MITVLGLEVVRGWTGAVKEVESGGRGYRRHRVADQHSRGGEGQETTGDSGGGAACQMAKLVPWPPD